MKLTIELDPVADRGLFDRVMAAVMDHPAPVTMEADTPSMEMSKDTPSDEKSDDTPEPEAKDDTPDQPSFRAHGEAGDGRKRRTKVEMAEDDEIDKLAAKTNLAIRTDIPATELLEEMRQADAEDEADEKAAAKSDDSDDGDEKDFDIEDTPEEMSAEEFRATVVKYSQKDKSKTFAVLKEYASALSKVPADKYAEVVEKLKDAVDA